MAKDPAFLFYPNDYIGGTMGMTFEEKGAYVELLMLQFNRGHMTTHMIGQTIGQLWDKIQDKFIQDEHGLWYNERLEQEKIRRKKFVESRYNNKTGYNQYTGKKKNKGGHMTKHMENENENENVNRNPSLDNVKKFFIENSYTELSAERAFNFYNNNNWKDSKDKPVKNWKNKMRNVWFKPENRNVKKLSI